VVEGSVKSSKKKTSKTKIGCKGEGKKSLVRGTEGKPNDNENFGKWRIHINSTGIVEQTKSIAQGSHCESSVYSDAMVLVRSRARGEKVMKG
jgi:hypothetical protein